MNKRYAWVDVAKAIGILAIVLGHIVDEGAVKCYVYSFHIPLFFFLSGATFRVNGKDFAAFVRRRARALLLPYAVFALVSQLVYVAMQLLAADVMSSGRSFSVAEGWTGILLGNVEANRGLWFLPCLFLMSLMLYPIVRGLEEGRKGSRGVAMFAMLASAAYTVLDACLLHIGNLPWKLDAALKLMSFALGGWFFLREAEKIVVRRSWICTAAVLMLVLGGFSGVMWNQRVRYLGSAYGNVFVFYLSSVCSVLGICLLLAGVKRNRILEYIGSHTLAILVMHKFPILFFEWVCPVVKDWMTAGVLPVELAVALVSVAMCCGVERIILKLCPLVLGRGRA